MIFQPHRYSRTKDFYNEFVNVLSRVDELMLLDIYAAGEESIPDITSPRLLESIETLGIIKPIYVEHLELVEKVHTRKQAQDENENRPRPFAECLNVHPFLRR